MTTENDSDQNTETNGDQGNGERPSPRRPAFLNGATAPSSTELAVGNFMMKRREKRGW
ncbi:MAG: hypothetical protein ABJF67_08070 [Aurantimonas coralicida]